MFFNVDFAGRSHKSSRRRWRRMRRISTLVLAVITVLKTYCITASAEEDKTVYNWYCVHVSHHVRPRADSRFDFIRRYGGYYLDEHSDCADSPTVKTVYLTFDVGYENGNVEKILDTMKEEGVTGAFLYWVTSFALAQI